MQPNSAPTICLSMIVKDEAHIIRRCLESVLPFIDRWAVCDTGSTDGTQDVIRATLADLPGELRERPWVDFGANRTEALALAKASGCDYTLVVDADETLVVEDPHALAQLTADAYRVEMRYPGGLSWPRVNLLRSALSWRYVGVIHEYAEASPPAEEHHLAGLHMWTDSAGARGRDPERAQRDLAIMEQSVIREPDNARYWFYLAQGYEVAHRIDDALRAYARRIDLAGNTDEVWYAHYRSAQLSVIQKNWRMAVLQYLEAYTSDPTRAEPLYWLASGYIDRGEDMVAMLFLEQVALIGKPIGAMFVEHGVYDYLRWIQYATTAHNLGRRADAQDIAGRLLASGKAPDRYRPLLERLAAPTEAEPELATAGG